MILQLSKKNSVNIVLLFFYTIALKWHYITNPQSPIINSNDGFLYQTLLKQLNSVVQYKYWCAIVAVVLLYVQAIQLSVIMGKYKYFQQVNYLPGAAYLLITSLYPNWNVLNSALLFNALLLFIWNYSFRLMQTINSKPLLFNIGILLGLSNLVFEYSFVYCSFVFFVLITYRPFKWFEFVIVLIGFLTPYYFFITISWLTNNYHFKDYALSFKLFRPQLSNKNILFISVMVILSITILGLYFVQHNNKRLPIQSRKVWGITFFLLLISCIPALFSNSLSFWVQSLIPTAAFCSAFFYYTKPPKLITTAHWLLFAYAFYCFFLYK